MEISKCYKILILLLEGWFASTLLLEEEKILLSFIAAEKWGRHNDFWLLVQGEKIQLCLFCFLKFFFLKKE